MIKIKKRLVPCVMVLMVLAILMSMSAITATAQEKIPIPTVQTDVYVYDVDNIIDDDVEQKLNKMLVELEEKTEAEFAVASVESLLNRTIEEYANNLFNTWGLGKKGKDNGVLLLMSRSDGRVRLEIGRGLEGCLNDSKCGRILDDYFVPYRENDEYTTATEKTVEAVLTVLAEEYQIDIQDLEKIEVSDEKTQEDTMSNTEVLVITLLVMVIIIIISMVFIIALDDSSGGGSSGSGFYSGGFSSGSSGGFSGGSFGGGFSGGGGASR